MQGETARPRARSDQSHDAEVEVVKSAETVVIDRTPTEVFRYVADLRNEPTWHVDVVSVPADADAVPVTGRTYALKFKPFMGKTDGTFTAVEVVPGERVVYRADFAGLQPLISYLVESGDGRTRFTRAVEVHPARMRRLMAPMLALMIPRRNKLFVRNLKAAMERQRPAQRSGEGGPVG
jgi:uncharacterized protein YndB with AHSA1/START domain